MYSEILLLVCIHIHKKKVVQIKTFFCLILVLTSFNEISYFAVGFCKYSSTTVLFFFFFFLFRLDTEGIELIAKFLQVRCVLWLYFIYVQV